MMNEIIFILHAMTISLFVLGALRMGKEALIGFISVACVLANLFVLKQINFFGFTATCSDALTVGAVLGLNVLQEYFGREQAKKAIWINFGLLIFYGIMTQTHLWYCPSACDTMHDAYSAILAFMPRIIIASFAVYLAVQHFDSWFYEKLKRLFDGKNLIIRNYISISSSQLLDTILFSFFGLYGIVENIWHIMFVSYAIKMATMIVAVPFITLSKKIKFFSGSDKESQN